MMGITATAVFMALLCQFGKSYENTYKFSVSFKKNKRISND
jgi:hypothetical protein